MDVSDAPHLRKHFDYINSEGNETEALELKGIIKEGSLKYSLKVVILRQIIIGISTSQRLLGDVILFLYCLGELLKGLIRVFKRRVLWLFTFSRFYRAANIVLSLCRCLLVNMALCNKVRESSYIIIGRDVVDGD